MKTIEITKALIPYTFDIVLGAENFTLKVDYNEVGGFFTIGVSKNGTTICAGSPIVYGRRLFEDVWSQKFPRVDIVPIDPSNSYNKVTYDNLCEGVYLVIDDGEESVLGG